MTEWKFRRISVGDGDQKHYFAMLRLHENASDFEASTIDLNVTLEQKTWKAEGRALLGSKKHRIQVVVTELARQRRFTAMNLLKPVTYACSTGQIRALLQQHKTGVTLLNHWHHWDAHSLPKSNITVVQVTHTLHDRLDQAQRWRPR